MAKHLRLADKDRQWIEARRRHRLSHAHAQMARELGMNPRKLGKIDNHKQEPWKAPPISIEDCYFRRFGKRRPDMVRPIEDRVLHEQRKKRQKTEERRARREAGTLPTREQTGTGAMAADSTIPP
jgi:hypothetical protein